MSQPWNDRMLTAANVNSNTTFRKRTLGSGEEIVHDAIHRTQRAIFTQSIVPWKFYPRNADFEPPMGPSKRQIHSIVIVQNGTDAEGAGAAGPGAVDESYTLRITTDGRVEMTAATSVGVLRALETFTQLFFQHSQDQSDVYSNLIPVEIHDSPKFAHRGLNLDLARNWIPVPDVLRTIDALAWNKFNRLHLHMTDSQSWPLEIPALPELAAKGAYRKDLTYSPADLEQMQFYAHARGVEVIVEIDMPGHMGSIALSAPELIAAFDMQPDWRTYSAEPPSGQIKLNHPAAFTFLDTLLDDLLPRLAPHGAYFHTGGDEVNANAYLFDETVKSNATAVIKPLLQKFLDHVHATVRNHGLVPMVWEEMLLEWNLTLGSDVVVQTWRSSEAVLATVQKGHKALVGNYNYWVLVSLPASSASRGTTTD
ncbi:MAG: N-acetyl-glucosamine-6-phosphate deacetylase [Thelocarpon superellum]|nr:MAG: N-acetyl-glucosamine-6-phosphate deacetylase [Thelocarpon superellum]